MALSVSDMDVAFTHFSFGLDTQSFITLQEAVLLCQMPLETVKEYLKQYFAKHEALICSVLYVDVSKDEQQEKKTLFRIVECTSQEKANQLLAKGGTIYSLQKVALKDLTALASWDIDKVDASTSGVWPFHIKSSSIQRGQVKPVPEIVCDSSKENRPLSAVSSQPGSRPQTLQSTSLTAKAATSTAKGISSVANDFFKARPPAVKSGNQKSAPANPLPTFPTMTAVSIETPSTRPSEAVSSSIPIVKEKPSTAEAKSASTVTSSTKRKSTAMSTGDNKRRCLLIDEDEDDVMPTKAAEMSTKTAEDAEENVSDVTTKRQRFKGLIDDDDEEDEEPRRMPVQKEEQRKPKTKTTKKDRALVEEAEEMEAESKPKSSVQKERIVETVPQGPHKVKRWVSKTFVDEDGFLVTERVLEETIEEDTPQPQAANKVEEVEEAVVNKQQAETAPKTTKAKPASPQKGKAKQTSLMNFFKKS